MSRPLITFVVGAAIILLVGCSAAAPRVEAAHQAPSAPDVMIQYGVVALYPQDGASSAELLCRADEALYRAKRAGRDRVMLSAPKSPSMDVALID
jgi:GGDEF domain-containing protein